MDHLKPQQLEAYAMGRLADDEIAPFEEHLLICETCQQALTAEDQYLLAMRTALQLPELEKVHSKRGWAAWLGFSWRGFAFAGALAMVILAGYSLRSWIPRAPVAVTLASFRGAESPDALASAPAGAPLELGIRSVDATSDCRIEIVSELGEPAWQGGLVSAESGLHAYLADGLHSGQYWVRLYAPDSRLLQEFGLRVE